jgi:hypothetical protein
MLRGLRCVRRLLRRQLAGEPGSPADRHGGRLLRGELLCGELLCG